MGRVETPWSMTGEELAEMEGLPEIVTLWRIRALPAGSAPELWAQTREGGIDAMRVLVFSEEVRLCQIELVALRRDRIIAIDSDRCRAQVVQAKAPSRRRRAGVALQST